MEISAGLGDVPPLSRHEIEKLLCSILATSDPARCLRGVEFDGMAFFATVSCLRGWCDPGDVEAALAWVTLHADRLFPVASLPN